MTIPTPAQMTTPWAERILADANRLLTQLAPGQDVNVALADYYGIRAEKAKRLIERARVLLNPQINLNKSRRMVAMYPDSHERLKALSSRLGIPQIQLLDDAVAAYDLAHQPRQQAQS